MKKLLLLGAGGSGKSTIFKQLKSIHGPGISSQERKSYKGIIIGNVIDFMRTLVEMSDKLSRNDRALEKCQMGEDVRPYANILLEQDRHDYHELAPNVSDAICRLWEDRGIRTTFEERSRFQMQDSAEYFFDERMDEIRRPDYMPTEKDVLLARVRTTGIIEQEFKVKEHTFRVFDVGGQRNERKKWIHAFENVTGVIFVASLSGYDQKLLEDDSCNRMEEALDLFAQLNDDKGTYGPGRGADEHQDNLKAFQQMGRWFIETAMILFLNKSDLFLKKIEKVPLASCPYFKDYKYPMFTKKKPAKGESKQMTRNDDGIEYIKHQFMRRNTTTTFTGHVKNVYVHVTNATDKAIIEKVFHDVQHILISQSLGEAGIM